MFSVLSRLLAVIASAALVSGGALAQSPRKVAINFGLTYVPVGNSPVFTVPRAMGFWKDEGLDVEVQLANGTGPALQQLIAGQVVGSVGGTPPVMSLIDQGAAIKVVGSFNSRNIYYPVVLASSRIKSIEDMKGAKVGVVSAASSNVYWIKGVTAKRGLDPEKDIELISVGSGPAALQALTSGRIDVLQLFEASYDQIEQKGFPLRRFTEDQEFNKLAFTFGLTVRQDTIDKDRALITGLLRGITKGIIYAKAHPQEVVKMHWTTYPLAKPQGVGDEEAMRLDLPILVGALKNHAWADKGKFGYALPEEVTAVRNTLREYKAITNDLPNERYFDPSFVEAGNDFDHAAVVARKPM
jgi:NitT/TauT family transport system substrate-binding protein